MHKKPQFCNLSANLIVLLLLAGYVIFSSVTWHWLGLCHPDWLFLFTKPESSLQQWSYFITAKNCLAYNAVWLFGGFQHENIKMDIHFSGHLLRWDIAHMIFLKNSPSVFMKHFDTTPFLLSQKLHHLDFAPTLPCPA